MRLEYLLLRAARGPGARKAREDRVYLLHSAMEIEKRKKSETGRVKRNRELEEEVSSVEAPIVS